MGYVEFTREMKRDYTILVPNMLPMHFEMIVQVLRNYGYHLDLLRSSGHKIADTGLKYCHNDACYPAILVIGQFIDALQSGKYDPHKTALIMFQTGGGCRASNYIFLIRKALEKAGYLVTWQEEDYGHEWRFWNRQVEAFIRTLPLGQGE